MGNVDGAMPNPKVKDDRNPSEQDADEQRPRPVCRGVKSEAQQEEGTGEETEGVGHHGDKTQSSQNLDVGPSCHSFANASSTAQQEVGFAFEVINFRASFLRRWW
jgi:hypothetical protein